MPTYRRRNFGKSNLGRYDWEKCQKHAQSNPRGVECVMCRREREARERAQNEPEPKTPDLLEEGQ